MAKFYQVEKEIRGKKYVCVFNGIEAALEMADSTYVDGTSNTSLVKLANYLFENVVVTPKNLKPDDFADMKEFAEVIAFAKGVAQGDIQPKEDKKGKSEE